MNKLVRMWKVCFKSLLFRSIIFFPKWLCAFKRVLRAWDQSSLWVYGCKQKAGTERLCKYIFMSVQLVSQMHSAFSAHLLLTGWWIRETREVPFLIVPLRASLLRSELLLGEDGYRSGSQGGST